MTPNQARHVVIEAMNYAAYRETDSSLHDSDKNRLFGSEEFISNRMIVTPSPWAEEDFEEKMTVLFKWAKFLQASKSEFVVAERVLEGEDSLLGRVIRRAREPT